MFLEDFGAKTRININLLKVRAFFLEEMQNAPRPSMLCECGQTEGVYLSGPGAKNPNQWYFACAVEKSNKGLGCKHFRFAKKELNRFPSKTPTRPLATSSMSIPLPSSETNSSAVIQTLETITTHLTNISAQLEELLFLSNKDRSVSQQQ